MSEKLEKEYQSEILKYLRARPKSFTFKAAAGVYSQAGIPDIIHVEGGRFFGFEVKRPTRGKVSAIQMATIHWIRAAGGVAEVVHGVDEVKQILAREGLS